MKNTQIYEAVRTVPKEAQREIQAGRLKGFTDINPMWRIRTLTEQFGPCGVGWYYEVTNRWTEEHGTSGTAAFVDINLYIKVDGEWSKPIHGTGGSSLVAIEKAGPRLSDEAYKMAETDALSVACKNLGFGADIYWAGGRTKYMDAETALSSSAEPAPTAKPKEQPAPKDTENHIYTVRIKNLEIRPSKSGKQMMVAEFEDVNGAKIPPYYQNLGNDTFKNLALTFMARLQPKVTPKLNQVVAAAILNDIANNTYQLEYNLPEGETFGQYKILEKNN